jgi:hypothetical protein
VVSNILEDNFKIEIAFFFAGFTQVSTRNLASISGDQHVLSKTIADGGSRNSTYIHRGQRDSFVSAYMANVRSIIYLESPNAASNLIAGLQEQFASLFDKGLEFFCFSSILKIPKEI